MFQPHMPGWKCSIGNGSSPGNAAVCSTTRRCYGNTTPTKHKTTAHLGGTVRLQQLAVALRIRLGLKSHHPILHLAAAQECQRQWRQMQITCKAHSTVMQPLAKAYSTVMQPPAKRPTVGFRCRPPPPQPASRRGPVPQLRAPSRHTQPSPHLQRMRFEPSAARRRSTRRRSTLRSGPR